MASKKYSGNPLQVTFPAGNLGSLDSTHLGDPSLSRLELSDCPDLITGVAWNANVIVAFKNELDISNLQCL
jgi:hypothetical protein